MDKILTTYAADGQPFIAPTSLDHLQNSYTNVLNALATGIVGRTFSSGTVYAIAGLKTTPGAGVTSYSPGLVYYNGEVLYFAGATLTDPTTPNVTLVNLAVTYAAADPTTFETGATHNVHQLRRVTLSNGTSGTGSICDFSAVKFVDTGYTTVPNASYSNGSQDPSNPLRYKREKNTVFMRGVLYDAGGDSADVYPVFVLPVGYRPTKNVAKAISAIGAITTVRIDNTGAVAVYYDEAPAPAVSGTSMDFEFELD